MTYVSVVVVARVLNVQLVAVITRLNRTSRYNLKHQVAGDGHLTSRQEPTMELLVVLFSIAAIVWMIPIFHGGRLLRMATVVLLTGTVVGPSFFAFNGPIQFSFDRMLWAAMLALAVIHWRMGNIRTVKMTRVDWMVAGMVGLFLISGTIQGAGTHQDQSFSRWIFYVLMPAGVYVITRLVEIRESDIRWMSRLVLGLCTYLAVTALFEVKGLHALVFPKYILDPTNWEFLGRGRGPLLNPIGNGFVISVGVAICCLNFIKGDRRMKVISAFMAMVLMVGVYATLTRSVWIGAMLGIGVIGFMYSPRWLRVLGLASIVLLVGALSLGLKDQLTALKRDKDVSAADAAKSITLRPLLAIVAWEMFKDKPIAGHGFGRYFENNKPYHDTQAYDVPLKEVKPYLQHNTFLAILVDTGLLGITLFCGFLFSISSIAWSLARERNGKIEVRFIGLLALAVLASYLPNAMFHDMLIIPMVHMFMFFVAGVLVTIHQRGFATSPEQSPVNRRSAVPAMSA